MLPSPTYQTAWSEQDVLMWLQQMAKEHEVGTRQTDHDLPEQFWEMADMVAERGAVTREDSDALSKAYEAWQNELNAEEAMSLDSE